MCSFFYVARHFRIYNKEIVHDFEIIMEDLIILFIRENEAHEVELRLSVSERIYLLP